MVVRTNLRRAGRSRTLLAETFDALTFVQAKGCDVHQCFYVRHAVRRPGNDDATIGVTYEHDRALQRGQQVLGYDYVSINGSEGQLRGHNVQTLLQHKRYHSAPRRTIRPRSVYEYYVCFRFHLFSLFLLWLGLVYEGSSIRARHVHLPSPRGPSSALGCVPLVAFVPGTSTLLCKASSAALKCPSPDRR